MFKVKIESLTYDTEKLSVLLYWDCDDNSEKISITFPQFEEQNDVTRNCL